MSDDDPESARRIRELNDALRQTFAGGVVMVTRGVEALPREIRRAVLAEVRAFSDFTADNDIHGEHDFGVIEREGVKCFWKIDYYNRDMEMTSPDPSDPDVTTRVLTVMLADEY
jgi:hypothetical protein